MALVYFEISSLLLTVETTKPRILRRSSTTRRESVLHFPLHILNQMSSVRILLKTFLVALSLSSRLMLAAASHDSAFTDLVLSSSPLPPRPVTIHVSQSLLAAISECKDLLLGSLSEQDLLPLKICIR